MKTPWSTSWSPYQTPIVYVYLLVHEPVFEDTLVNELVYVDSLGTISSMWVH